MSELTRFYGLVIALYLQRPRIAPHSCLLRPRISRPRLYRFRKTNGQEEQNAALGSRSCSGVARHSSGRSTSGLGSRPHRPHPRKDRSLEVIQMSNPLLKDVIWLGGNRVKLRFTCARKRVFTTELPIASARRAKVVDCGMGLDIGDGFDFSAFDLYDRLTHGRPIRHRKVIQNILRRRHHGAP